MSCCLTWCIRRPQSPPEGLQLLAGACVDNLMDLADCGRPTVWYLIRSKPAIDPEVAGLHGGSSKAWQEWLNLQLGRLDVWRHVAFWEVWARLL